MPPGQNQTQLQQSTQENAEGVRSDEVLKFLQNEYITFCASSGISQDEDGNFVTMTVKDFAIAAGVARSTLYAWQKSIPNFWTLVDQRAREIFNQSTKFAIFKGLKLKAMTGDVKAAEMVLSHYSDYTPPAQKHEVKLSGWGDLVRRARTTTIKANRPVQEAEVIPPSTEKTNPLPTGYPSVIPPRPTPVTQDLSPKPATPVQPTVI